VLYYVDHDSNRALVNQESAPYFNLNAVLTASGETITLIEDSGMFAYPALSPEIFPGEFQLAWLQAIFPTQSEASRYRLHVMDRDGSERRLLFPPENQPGLQPQRVAWAPSADENGRWYIALLYEGNLWLVDAADGRSRQITGDGLITRLDWR
jgi:hypothetical protein